MRTGVCRAARRLGAACLIWGLLAGVTAANGLPRGARTVTPAGAVTPLADVPVAVSAERLGLDVRDTAAVISAAYRLRNQTAQPLAVTVLFPFPRQAGNPQLPAVTLDGAALPVTLSDDPLPIPPADLQVADRWLDPWTGAAYMPQRFGRRPEPPAAARFEVTLAPHGEHSLEVRYRDTGGYDHDHYLVRVHRYDYLLRPAAHWAGFGSLTVRVTAGPEQTVRASLPLGPVPGGPEGARVYEGRFDALPDANLSLFVARAAPGPVPAATSLWLRRDVRPWLLLGGAMLLGAAAGLMRRPARSARVQGIGRWLPLWGIPLIWAMTPPALFGHDPIGNVVTVFLFMPACAGALLLPWLLLRKTAA